MSYVYHCPACGEGIEIEDRWAALGDLFPCSRCKTKIFLEYDESYDSETGDECGFFCLTRE